MKISELIKILEHYKKIEGDLSTCIDTLSHSFPPDVAVKERNGRKVLLLNS